MIVCTEDNNLCLYDVAVPVVYCHVPVCSECLHVYLNSDILDMTN